jgi:predicted RNA-binding Zn-ribbon protein involved in translation (DUF1610 family)
MGIELLKDEQDKRAKFVCPACRKVMIVSMAAYDVDATKPILSNCPYCGAGIFSCAILLASRNLKQLQGMIAAAVNAVGPSISRQQIIIDGKVLGEPS